MRPLLLILLLTTPLVAKPKVISFGRWATVQWMIGDDERRPQPLRVRPLLVNGESKEITLGEPHDVTDRVFVVQTAVKINDRLPDEGGHQRWTWRPAGWIMVDRTTAHITRLSLPEFDAFVSVPVWFRDYAAYCGVSDTGDKLYALVFQIGRRKPVLKKLLGAATDSGEPGAQCSEAVWQRQPLRVTFHPANLPEIGYTIRSFATEIPLDSRSADGNGEEGQ